MRFYDGGSLEKLKLCCLMGAAERGRVLHSSEILLEEQLMYDLQKFGR